MTEGPTSLRPPGVIAMSTLSRRSQPSLNSFAAAAERAGVELAPASATRPRSFASASSPYLWGGIQLDPGEASRVALAETLVHEASHTLLNGLVDAGELSTNPKDARYSSPLRVDARPMDGIIHATYVLGRMGMALAEIAEAGELTEAERRDVAKRRRENDALFQQGLATIREHGKLTPSGAAALEGCFALGSRSPENAEA